MRKKNIFLPSKKNNMYIGILKLANNDDNEEYLVIIYNNNQVTINTNPKNIFIQNKIPTYVATPFPPLNFSHKGKT